jgi:predicted transcriptional regulator
MLNTPVYKPLPIFPFDPRAEGLERWLGPLETAIMEALWTVDTPRTVKRLWGELHLFYKPIAYTTVMTTMTRLWEKGMLDREKVGMSYSYITRETRAEFEERQIAAVLRSLEVPHG